MYKLRQFDRILSVASVFIAMLFVNVKSETDSTIIRLPKIELRNDAWESPGGVSMSNGMFMQHPPTKFNRHYFSAGDSVRDVRVNYLATNLSMVVKPIPSAYSKLQRYKTLRIITPTLLVTGLTIGIAGFATQMNDPKDENGDIPPPNFTVPIIGLGIVLTSWIPRIISNGMVEESVNIYNSKISGHK